MDQVVRQWLPDPIRRLAGRTRAELVAGSVRRELTRLARSGRPVLAGPWLGEVGFELLYWIPFLRWAVEEGGLDVGRIVAVSRGGPETWYRGVAARYRDAFDYLTADEFRARNDERRREVGEQKQVRVAGLDRELAERVRDDLQAPDLEMLHPSLMYSVMQPYWWQHAPIEWVDRFARFRPVVGPDSRALGLSLPESYVAVKFYFNDCFTPTTANHAFIAATLERLAAEGPVVTLSTGFAIDDHRPGSGLVRCTDLAGHPVMTPRNNLAVQTAVVAGARAFVGTYGGFSYLAPFLGLDATAVWSERGGFDPRHLLLAQRVLRRQERGTLAVAMPESSVDRRRAAEGAAT